MCAHQLCANLFMDGPRIGMLLVTIWREIFTDIINYAKNIIRDRFVRGLVAVCFDYALGSIFKFL